MSPIAALGFLPGSPGPGEVLLIFVVVLLLFGPKRLPEIARMVGRMLEQLRRSSQEFKDQVMRIGEDSSSRRDPEHRRIASVPPAGKEEAPADSEPPTEEEDGDERNELAG